MNRYLTVGAKNMALAEWSYYLDTAPRTGPELPGGRGGVDEEIVPWCAGLNDAPGVMTLQSCTGHAPSPGEAEYTACLWLWLSRERSDALYLNAPRFAALPTMERLSTFWQPNHQQVWDLRFKGPAQGEGLVETIGPLLWWLQADDMPETDGVGVRCQVSP